MDFVDTNATYKIVPANWRDLGALRKLERECFPLDAWPLFDLIAVLSFPNVVRFKSIVQGEIVGFVAGEQRLGENLAWIVTIGVLPDFQRNGIGSALLDACEQGLGAPRIRLCVRIGNTPAIQLYKILGYQQVGMWTAYYQDRSDAIVFEKSFRSTL